jgi:BlaI family transcriptional regulator, penicillinase repressor
MIGGRVLKNKKLTPVEWEIIDKIWELGGSPSIREIWEKCFPNGEKAYTTVQTIMNTLEKKGILERKKIGLVNFYKPLKSREEAVKSEMTGVVARIFNGSVPALANYLINSENLSLKEIEKIKKLLNEKEEKLRSKS